MSRMPAGLIDPGMASREDDEISQRPTTRSQALHTKPHGSLNNLFLDFRRLETWRFPALEPLNGVRHR